MNKLNVEWAKKLQAVFPLPRGKQTYHIWVSNGEHVGIVINLNFGNGNRQVQWLSDVGNVMNDWVVNKKWFAYDQLIYLPSLDTLLDWLEDQGYIPTLTRWEHPSDGVKRYECCLLQAQTGESVFHKGIVKSNVSYVADTHPVVAQTREDAVAKAIWWVIQQNVATEDLIDYSGEVI